jgi:nucleoside-diphosphate-sugar epimerase
MAMLAGEPLACVTGAGGFIASSLVKELLQRVLPRERHRKEPW